MGQGAVPLGAAWTAFIFSHLLQETIVPI